MIFLDASVICAVEDSSDRHHEAALALVRQGTPLATLDLAFYEVTNVAIRRWVDPDAATRLRAACTAIAEDGKLVRVTPELAEGVAGISAKHGISAYDAAYVAGARQVGAALASCDEADLVGPGLASLPGDLLDQPNTA